MKEIQYTDNLEQILAEHVTINMLEQTIGLQVPALSECSLMTIIMRSSVPSRHELVSGRYTA